jgi:hypothetical protein
LGKILLFQDEHFGMVEENKQNDNQGEEVEVKYNIYGADELEKQHGQKLKDYLHILERLSAIHSFNKLTNVLQQSFIFLFLVVNHFLVFYRIFFINRFQSFSKNVVDFCNNRESNEVFHYIVNTR